LDNVTLRRVRDYISELASIGISSVNKILRRNNELFCLKSIIYISSYISKFVSVGPSEQSNNGEFILRIYICFIVKSLHPLNCEISFSNERKSGKK
jgi:hypothetical protein